MMLRVTRLQVNLLVSGGGTPEDQGPAAAPDHQSRRQQRQLTGQVIAVEAAQCRKWTAASMMIAATAMTIHAFTKDTPTL